MAQLDRIKPLRLLNTKLQYPYLSLKDKLHGSVIYLLAKNRDGVIDYLNNNTYLINNNTFVSYYTEKNYTKYIGSTNEQASLSSSSNNDYCYCLNEDKVYYPDKADKLAAEYITEDYNMDQKYKSILRKLLYKERIKNQKELIAVYDVIKEKVPFIKNTFLNIKAYRTKNLIVDWSYYASLFFKNYKPYSNDKDVDLLHHILTTYLMDTRYIDYGYKRFTCIIPVESWLNSEYDIFDYKHNLNPFSMIFRLVKTGKKISEYWKGITFLIASRNAYFTVNDFSNFDKKDLVKFVYFTKKLIANDISDIKDDSDSIIPNVSDVLGVTDTKTKVSNKDVITSNTTNTELDKEPDEEKADTVNPDEDWVKSVVSDLNNSESDTGTKLTPAREKRMAELDDGFNKMTLNNKKVGDVLKTYLDDDTDLKPEAIPIDNINEEWKDIKSLDFDKSYDITDDIIAILKSLRYKSKPLSVVKMEAVDTSTRDDYIYTLKVTLEDMTGTRSNITIDIPKLINHRFMKLRGNLKTISGEILLLPIIKTEANTCQIVTSYHKIFIYRINPSNGSKSTKAVSKLTKALSHLKDSQKPTGIVVFSGDNSMTYDQYDLPIEYFDLGSLLAKITCKDGSYVSFDYKKMCELYGKKFDDTTYIPYAYNSKTNEVLLTKKDMVAKAIGNFLSLHDATFAEIYADTIPSNKLSYSEASIMSTRIPVIVLQAFSEGLQKAMDKSGIKYRISDKRPKLEADESAIKFKDGYLIYNDAEPKDSLLMTGLVKCDSLKEHSITEMNNKTLWLEMLDNFGGRIVADGLDNFYDCEFDPMTITICKRYNMPYDYIKALAYANELLATNMYNKHADISGNRIRKNEILAGYFYQVIANAYGDYSNKFKRAGKGTKYTVKQSALIDIIMKDPGFTDLSISTPIQEAKSANTVSFKGLSGMNSDRAYTIDKRVYDKSMVGVLSMSTGFAGNSGISRETTINASLADKRGIISSKKINDMSTLNTLSIYEALTPYTSTHDDPIRVAMGYVQIAQHQMRVKSSSPSLITYGMDEALPYFTSDMFSYKFKGVKGKVLKADEHLIIFEEVDKDGTKSKHFISLDPRVEKNSDGGFFVTIRFISTVKKGDNLHYNDILAYDPTAYSKALATDDKNKNISYNIGTLAKVAIMCTDQAYEDSSIINTRISDAMTSFYCVQKQCSLDAGSNVFNIVKKGQEIEEGSPLLIFQNAFDDKEANMLMKNISDDEVELATDFGRIHVRSKITGVVEDIKIYRTCDLDELSPSLRKIVSSYERNIENMQKELKKDGVSDIEIRELTDDTGKQEPIGKLKNVENGVMFEFYIKCTDKMGIGDKLIYNTAIKGTVHDIIPPGQDPYTEFRPNEPIDAFLATASVNARMVPSAISCGIMNKIIIELTRKCKDILGIKWNNLTNVNNL